MNRQAVLTEALRLAAAGFSIIPVGGDKRPLAPWQDAQERRAEPDALKAEFTHPHAAGAAVVTGRVSGGLLVLDFDHDDKAEAVCPFDLELEFCDPWLGLIVDDIDPGSIPRQRTGGSGWQFFVRCAEPCGNLKLASVPANNRQGFITVVETRGQGGYTLVPPSAHPSGNRYRWAHLDLTDAPLVTPAQLEVMLTAARALDRVGLAAPTPKSVALPRRTPPREGERDVIGGFNAAHTPTELLEAHGYRWMGAKLLSPDSSSGNPGVSVLRGDDGLERVYSHHADGLGDGRAHDAFGVFTLLEHGGDQRAAYRAAAQELGLWEERRPASQAGPKPRSRRSRVYDRMRAWG